MFSMSLSSAHAATPVKAGPNVNIIPGNDRQQAETTVAVDPRNPSIVVAGAQDYNLQSGCCPPSGHRWHGYYRSTDGGKTWSTSLVPGFPGDNSPQGLASPLHGFELTSDPVLAFDRAGNVYYTGIALSFSKGGNVNSVSGFVAKYSNDGADFAGATLISFGRDKPWIAVDVSGGTNDGNIYVVLGTGSFKNLVGSMFTRSTDHGATFSDPILLSTSAFVTGVAMDQAGTIFVSFLGNSNIPVSRSTDGGITFTSVTVAATIVEVCCQFQGNRFRVLTLPQIAADSKGVYIVWDDNRTGDSDVLFSRSLDKGLTWSSPLRINDVTLGLQFFPTIAVSDGTISVAWYDSRLGQLSNGTIAGLDLFYARSTDAGTSFSKNLRVTSSSFNPNAVRTVDFARNGPFMGDYIQIAAGSGTAHPVWADNRNACDLVDQSLGCLDEDAFTATITY